MHGNEPAGVHALERVARVLGENRDKFRGQFVGLTGNVGALHAGLRFQAKDLNRMWMDEQVDSLRKSGSGEIRYAEAQEQYEILTELESLMEHSNEKIFVLDLHTTSVKAAPFAVVTEDFLSRSFAASLPIPIIIGLTRHLDGTLMEYVSEVGHIPITVEGGQHDSAEAPKWLEAAVWLAMDSADMLSDDFSSRLSIASRTLEEVAVGPRELEVRYRHGIAEDDEFRMEPGFENFQTVKTNQLLARDRRGEIRSPSDGRILMPLYQNLGEEGFFIGRECDHRRHWIPFKK